MTYCVAVMVNAGLVFASDSRTNAGVDQLSTYSKMFSFGVRGDRALALLTAGNLATTQAVVAKLKRDMQQERIPNLSSVGDLEEAAEYIGEVSIAQQNKHTGVHAEATYDHSASFIFGGQIGTASPELYLIYSAGNHICATLETPYQQIGEVKYGKPILDRIIRRNTSLEEAALCALVSMDSTMRSNATVGPPIEVLIYERDSLRLDRRFYFPPDDAYLLELKQAWDHKIKEAFSGLRVYSWTRPAREERLRPGDA